MSDKVKQEIVQYEERFLQALRDADAEILAGFIHGRLIYNNFMGQVLTKKMDVEGFKSANPVIEKVDCIEREIQIFDDTAIVSTVVYMKGSFGGNQVEGKSRFLRTWKRFDGGWKIIAAASVNL